MTTTDLRCPQCGSLVRTELLWCGLCHADLRPPPVTSAPAAPIAEQLAAPAPYDLGVSAAALPVAAPARTGGKHAKPQPTVHPAGSAIEAAVALDTADLPPEVLAQLGLAGAAPDLASGGGLDTAFAMLRAEHRDPFLTRVQTSTSTGGGKVALIAGGAVVLTGLILFVFFVVGAVAI